MSVSYARRLFLKYHAYLVYLKAGSEIGHAFFGLLENSKLALAAALSTIIVVACTNNMKRVRIATWPKNNFESFDVLLLCSAATSSTLNQECWSACDELLPLRSTKTP
jgi:hypothetical protein